MKITNVETMVLDTGKNYNDFSSSGECNGVRFICLVKISTDEGIVGWADVETQPHVGAAFISPPSSGAIGFEPLRKALIDEDPFQRERLWQKMYRYVAYYGRQGAGMQMISGIDVALWDIAGKAFGQPISKLLGAQYRTQVKAYASTLFRSHPDDMKRAVAEYLRYGFKAIKFGWGVFGRDFSLDQALIRAAREEAGPDVDLMIDAGWYGTDDDQGAADNADFVFLTTPDDAIPDIVDTVRWHYGQYVVHCSGADSLDVLEPARIIGARVGSFHPLQTFASVQKAIDNLPGSTFALEADGALLDILKEMALSLNGHWIKLRAGDKAAYHAAAVMTSNYIVTLIKLATDLWNSFGIPRDQALQAILPLLKGTVNNLENLGLPNALTGPIARGDIGTVQIHLKALTDSAPDILPAYCELGLQTVPVALAKGKINELQALNLENILKVTLKSNVEREEKCAPC